MLYCAQTHLTAADSYSIQQNERNRIWLRWTKCDKICPVTLCNAVKSTTNQPSFYSGAGIHCCKKNPEQLRLSRHHVRLEQLTDNGYRAFANDDIDSENYLLLTTTSKKCLHFIPRHSAVALAGAWSAVSCYCADCDKKCRFSEHDFTFLIDVFRADTILRDDTVPVCQCLRKQQWRWAMDVREEHLLYCVCKTPYDDSQFMIQCDNCKDWFHGR